jgi:hypothetical protein
VPVTRFRRGAIARGCDLRSPQSTISLIRILIQTEMRFALSMAVAIDIVAAVKEALQDPEVRDRIRTIVQEALPPPGDPVEGLVDAKSGSHTVGNDAKCDSTDGLPRRSPVRDNRSPGALSTLPPLQKPKRGSKSRRGAAVSMPDSEDLNPPKARPNPMVDVVADRLEQHPTDAGEIVRHVLWHRWSVERRVNLPRGSARLTGGWAPLLDSPSTI